MTNSEMALRLAAIQGQAYDLFDVTSSRVSNEKSEEMSEWILDQIAKTSFADMLNEDVVAILDDGLNAHLVSVCLSHYLKCHD